MKKAFTMIELIFVIIIIGILASTAIPKLTATRDDALASQSAFNLTIAITDAGMQYNAKQNFTGLVSTLSCYRLVYTESNATVDITRVQDFDYCTKSNKIIDSNNGTSQYVFGGTKVVF